jgi:hypothetical protein
VDLIPIFRRMFVYFIKCVSTAQCIGMLNLAIFW